MPVAKCHMSSDISGLEWNNNNSSKIIIKAASLSYFLVQTLQTTSHAFFQSFNNSNDFLKKDSKSEVMIKSPSKLDSNWAHLSLKTVAFRIQRYQINSYYYSPSVPGVVSSAATYETAAHHLDLWGLCAHLTAQPQELQRVRPPRWWPHTHCWLGISGDSECQWGCLLFSQDPGQRGTR